MKRMIKPLSALLVCAVLLAVSFTAQAVEPKPVFTVKQSSYAYPGEEFTVDIDINSNRGFCAGEFTLNFDSSTVTPIEVEKGEDSGAYFVGNKDYAENRVYFAVLDTDLIKSAGTIATITFKVKDDVVMGDGMLDLNVSSLVGNVSIGYGLNNVAFSSVSGSMLITRRMSVPTAADPLVRESLFVKGSRDNMVLSGTDWKNLIPTSVAENFTDVTSSRFFARNGVTEVGASHPLTTGCIIKLYQDSVLADTMTVSVKGDINGDYKKDGYDAFLAGMVESGLLTDSGASAAEINAADADDDGNVGANDFSSIEANGLTP